MENLKLERNLAITAFIRQKKALWLKMLTWLLMAYIQKRKKREIALGI